MALATEMSRYVCLRTLCAFCVLLLLLLPLHLLLFLLLFFLLLFLLIFVYPNMELWREERDIGTNCPKLGTNGRTNGRTNGQKKRIVEVGAPPKKWKNSLFLNASRSIPLFSVIKCIIKGVLDIFGCHGLNCGSRPDPKHVSDTPNID